MSKKYPSIAARDRGPGPGRYGLPTTIGCVGHDPTKHMKPALTFGLKLKSQWDYSIGPGPAYAVDPVMTRHGKDGTPHYTMLARRKDLTAFKVPGPGTYCPEKHAPLGETKPPEYSMSARTRYRKRDSNPAPNTYSLPKVLGSNLVDMNSAAAYTINKRIERGSYLEDLANTPGPCKYRDVPPDLYKNRKPIYTMLARNELPGDSTQKPGPGSHYPEHVELSHYSPPKFSMGIRHSEYMCPLITNVPEVTDD